MTFEQFVGRLLYPELFPALTAPSFTFTSNRTGLREIGVAISITFTATFNPGVINPQYQSASGRRAGAVTGYDYTGTGLVDTSATSDSNVQTVTGYQPHIGANTWQAVVSYAEGAQPKGSNGTDYLAPLPSGTLSGSVTITGVYPVYATTTSIDTMTKQTLLAHGAVAQTAMVSETGGNKQSVAFPSVWPAITCVQFLNTLSNQYEWLGGDKAGSLSTFTKTDVEAGGQYTTGYSVYTHNGSTIGARTLRWHTT